MTTAPGAGAPRRFPDDAAAALQAAAVEQAVKRCIHCGREVFLRSWGAWTWPSSEYLDSEACDARRPYRLPHKIEEESSDG